MGEARLREFEELVLLAVLAAVPEAHGPSLQRILERAAGRRVSLGAIYTALERLSRKGFVRSALGEPTPVRGGRRKRHYELTPEGLAEVREVRRIRDWMWQLADQGLPDGGKAK